MDASASGEVNPQLQSPPASVTEPAPPCSHRRSQEIKSSSHFGLWTGRDRQTDAPKRRGSSCPDISCKPGTRGHFLWQVRAGRPVSGGVAPAKLMGPPTAQRLSPVGMRGFTSAHEGHTEPGPCGRPVCVLRGVGAEGSSRGPARQRERISSGPRRRTDSRSRPKITT